jgi:hypothetical protein
VQSLSLLERETKSNPLGREVGIADSGDCELTNEMKVTSLGGKKYSSILAAGRFAGDRVSTNEQVDTVYVLEVRPFEGDGLSLITSGERTKNIKFDGKDYPNVGSGMKIVSSAQRVNERTVELRDKIGGKVVDVQEISVSEDGKTLTIAVHVPARSKPNVLMFERE